APGLGQAPGGDWAYRGTYSRRVRFLPAPQHQHRAVSRLPANRWAQYLRGMPISCGGQDQPMAGFARISVILEEGHDGARRMIKEGVLDAAGQPLTAAYAVHVAAGQPRGVFMTRPGPILAALDVLTVTVRGRGGHASVPHRARDPVPAACE